MLMIAVGAIIVVALAATLIRRAPSADTAPAAAAGAPAPSQRVDIGQVLRTPQFIVLAAVFFLCCAAHSGPIFHTVSYAMICGATPLAAAGIYSVEGLAGLFGRLLFGVLGDRFGVKRVIVGGLLLQAVGIYSYIYVSGINDFYIRAVILGMAYGGVMPLYSILARDYFPQRVMGTVLGGITMTSSIGMAFGPLGGGWLFDTFGTYHWLYIASAAIGVGAALMALTFPRPTSGASNEPGTPAPQAA
jgi:predicted MFS family arabinose efflux permease